MCVFDNLDAFNWHDERQERMLSRRPKCFWCDDHIQDEHCYEYEGDLYCPDCMEDNHPEYMDIYHRESTEDYVR